ncbi:MAG: NAD(+) synthase, partial [Firmicutes bacterium]|nr:NAD(+) synthase [Bacillota bacterium]
MATDLGLIRVGAAVPVLEVADTKFNTDEIIRMIKEAEDNHTGIVVFPELCITGYSCADLFFQHQLYNRQIKSLFRIAETTKGMKIVVV